MSKSLLEAFKLKRPKTEPGTVYDLVRELVKDSRRVRFNTDNLNRVRYFECITSKHSLIREVQVYDD